MRTSNEHFQDGLIRHQIFLTRFSGLLRNQLAKIIDKSEDRLSSKTITMVEKFLKERGIDLTRPEIARRIRQFSEDVYEERRRAFALAEEEFEAQMLLAMEQERDFLEMAAVLALPVAYTFARSTRTVDVFSLIVDGKTVRQWWDDMVRSDSSRLMQQFLAGLTQGESALAIRQRMIGSRLARGADGATEVTRRHLESVIRTAVMAAANAERELFFNANEDAFPEDLYRAVLDSRTTPICRSLDGKIFKRNEGPFPPLHNLCRSVRIGIFTRDIVGTRAAKPTTEKILLGEFSRVHNLGKISSRDQLPFGYKGRYDDFVAKRLREMVGVVPASLNYEQWLKNQSRAFQEEVLGIAKAQLFREGGLPLERFVNTRGDELTLKELAKRERSAFIAAGLDPDDYGDR